MTFLATNLQLLRERRKASQQDVADSLRLKRSTYSGYEAGTNEPKNAVLIGLATYHRISVDRLLKHDLRTLTQFYLGQLERGEDKLFYLPAVIHPVYASE